MRIRHVAVVPLQAPLLVPFRIATGQHDSLDNVALELTLADGTKGHGEAAVATHITGETVPLTTRNLDIMADYLRGQHIEQCLLLCAYVRSLLPKNMAAVAAVEMALFDALTRHLGIPLWKLWGRSAQRLSTDITIVIGTLEETSQSAQRFYAQGFRAFKIKVGRDAELDFERVKAVARVTKKSNLILDANQGFTADQAIRFLRRLRKAGVRVDLMEQPVPKDDHEGLRRIGRVGKVLVCADESVASLSDAVAIIKNKAAGAINIKFMKTGLVEAMAIAHMARGCGLKLMMGGMMESPLAMTASAHMAAALGCFDFIDLDTPFFIRGGLDRHPCLNHRGVYDVGRIQAGIGIVP